MRLFSALLLPVAHAVVTELSTQQLFDGIQENKFQVIVDVRSQAEFDAGHIEGATLLENLFYFGMGSLESSTPADLEGCELCHIAVYDRSGGRTINAIEILETAGFMNLYNGQGTSQWTTAGFPLVTDASVAPPCATDAAAQDECRIAQEEPTAAPTVDDPSKIRTLDAAQFVQLRNEGMFDVILDVREDSSGGHITGATLIGPLTEENLSSLDGCSFCNIVAYGESAQGAADLLVQNEFGGRMYLGPSVTEYVEAGFALTTDDSIEPRCTTDPIIQEACEARYLDDGGESGGEAGGTEPTEAPSIPSVPLEPTGDEPGPTPTKAPIAGNAPVVMGSLPPVTGTPTSGIQLVSVRLSFLIGSLLFFLL